MTAITSPLAHSATTRATAGPARPARRGGWLLMGDIAASRAEIPLLLIEWQRARGLPDPAPPERLRPRPGRDQ